MAKLLNALLSINAAAPRLIASPPAVAGTVSRRASVAIIIRLRPDSTPGSGTPTSANSTPPDSTSPFVNPISLAPSPPSSPQRVPSPVQSPSPPLSSISSVPQASEVPSVPTQLKEFFDQPWVQNPGTTAEILFIKRASRATDKWSGHIAFPGGRQEPEDEDGRYTAMRETWEEVGLDLAEKEWLAVGQLDDREITTSLGKRLLMILSPFVFLHTSPHTPMPELQETEVASAHWIPIDLLHAPRAKYGSVGIDISTRLAPRSPVARSVLRFLIGSMHFRCVLLPNEPVAIGQITPEAPDGRMPDLRLWGLTLGMTLDLLSYISILPPPSSPLSSTKSPQGLAGLNVPLSTTGPVVAHSMESIFPRFSYPDINFLIWIFGFRYRRLLSHSQNPLRGKPHGPAESRVNWAGVGIGFYYAAVRRALVVAVVLRAIGAIGGLGWFGWWVARRLKERRRLGL